MEVDRSVPGAPYRQIARQIQAAIVAGDLTGRLPSAVGISQEAGVAVLTARKALRVVVEAGYARTVAGIGTFALPREDWPADD